MARKPRIHYEGALYHVIVRGNNREYIFNEAENKELYIRKLDKYIKKYQAKLYAYVIMDNHAHLLVEVTKVPLSKIMQLIQQTYTQSYNKQKGRTGHVFEQRYKAFICNKDEYLLTLMRYIHQNPVRAGIADINYKWSSHSEYRTSKAQYCDVELPLLMFSIDRTKAVERYLDFVDEIDDVIDRKLYELGSDEMKRIKIEEPRINRDLEGIVDEMKELYNTDIEELKGRSKNKKISKIKEEFIKKIICCKIMNQKQLSEFLQVSEQTISRTVNKF